MAITIITDDDLHASLQRIALIGSPHESSSVSPAGTEGGASGNDLPPSRSPGASVPSFNLGACFKMGEGR